MQKKKLAGVVITFSAFTLLAGCQQAAAPQKPAEEVIKEGMAKLTDITSYRYEFKLNGDVKDSMTDEKVNFNMNLGGQIDVKNPAEPKLTVSLTGSGSDAKGNGGNGSFDLRMNKEAVYFNVKSFEMKGEGAEAIPAEVKDLFGKWWKVALPPEVVAELQKSVPQGEEGKLTPEQEKMKKLIDETNFFSKPTYVGMEDVMGEQSYHYTGTLDKQALLSFMKKAAEEQGESISESEMAEAEEGLKVVDITGDIYVGATSGVLNKFSGTIKMNGTTADQPQGTLNISFAVGDINKPVTVDVPSDATDFPIEEFMSGFMGGMSSSMGGDMMMDSSSMMDGSGLDATMMEGSSMDPSIDYSAQ